ncbi:MAG: SDR family NAD(P)-dependent oxidoreductase [Lautropia sp.]
MSEFVTNRLAGRVAVITGGAGDIGRAIARRLLAEGARVALLDCRSDRLDAALADLGGSTALLALACDIADPPAVADAVGAVVGRFGRLDILVNNAAAATPVASVIETSEDDWRRMLDVDVTGAWLLARECVPRMVRTGGGVVLNIASQLGQVAAPGRGAYGVGKAALIALARALAVEHAAQGIRAASLSPGAILTDRLLQRYGDPEAVRQRLGSRYPLGRIGTVEEVAAAAAFLVSDDAAFVTGTDLLVDGGYMAV